MARMMKSVSLALFCWLVFTQSINAQIVRGEYYFDTDPGVGLATQFSLPEEEYLDGTFDFPTNELAVGEHVLGIRIRNERVWSITHTQTFFL